MGSRAQARSYGIQAPLLRGLGTAPEQSIEPVSLSLENGFLSTAPRGKFVALSDQVPQYFF